MPVPGLVDDEVDTTAEVSDEEEEREGERGEEANRHPDPPLSPALIPHPPAGAMPTAASVGATPNYDHYHHHHSEDEDDEEEDNESYFTPQKVRGYHNMAYLGASSLSPCKKRSRPGSSGRSSILGIGLNGLAAGGGGVF